MGMIWKVLFYMRSISIASSLIIYRIRLCDSIFIQMSRIQTGQTEWGNRWVKISSPHVKKNQTIVGKRCWVKDMLLFASKTSGRRQMYWRLPCRLFQYLPHLNSITRGHHLSRHQQHPHWLDHLPSLAGGYYRSCCTNEVQYDGLEVNLYTYFFFVVLIMFCKTVFIFAILFSE